jgi:O-glycosyl hydrolase
LLALAGCLLLAVASPADAAPRREPPASSRVQSWVTTAAERKLLTPVPNLSSGADSPSAPNRVVVDDQVRRQVSRGAGAAMTKASAVVLARMPAADRQQVMRRLFSPTDGIGLSLVRQPPGATAFSLDSWTYDDVADGSSDPALLQFTTSRDATSVQPLIRSAAALQPALSVVAPDPDTGAVSDNVEYYVLGRVTKASKPGAVRIGSTSFGTGRVESVAFRNPDGTTAVVLHNNAGTKQTATVVRNGTSPPVTLPAGAVQTLLC